MNDALRFYLREAFKLYIIFKELCLLPIEGKPMLTVLDMVGTMKPMDPFLEFAPEKMLYHDK